MSSRPSTRFETDTRIQQTAAGRFAGRCDRGWWIVRGPNGGYVGAVILRAAIAHVADPARSPTSLTIHYLAPPAEGDWQIEVVTERSGRQFTYLSGRLVQGDRLCALFLAAFSTALVGPTFDDWPMPEVPRPAAIAPPRLETQSPERIVPLRRRYDQRHVWFAEPFSGGREAVTGGWIRFADRTPLDACGLVAYADSWMPAIAQRITTRIGAPTVDLTIHFRAPIPPISSAEADPSGVEDFVLLRFETRHAAHGVFEEDGWIWAPDGTLLAISRQLALALPEG
jgi:acyl-CoA thioesterase